MMAENENRASDLHGEVMACAYEDVQVMWSILDKSKSTPCNITSWYIPKTSTPKEIKNQKYKNKSLPASAVSN